MPLISARGRQRKEHLCKFRANSAHIVNSRLAGQSYIVEAVSQAHTFLFAF